MKNGILILVMAMALLAPDVRAGANRSAAPFANRLDSAAQGEVFGKDELIRIQVGARGLTAINAVHFDLEFNSGDLEFVTFEAGDVFSNPMLFGPFLRPEKNVVDVTIATPDGPISPGEAPLGTVVFRVLNEGGSRIRLVSFQTSDGAWEVDTQVDQFNPVTLNKIPVRTRLVGNTPNPFNPTTAIRFELAERTEVKLDIYSVSGRHVSTLVSETRDAGVHTISWDGKDGTGNDVSSGVYFSRFVSNGVSQSSRMTLVR